MKRILIVGLTTLIIAIVGGLALFNYLTASQVEKAKDTTRMTDLRTIEGIIELFYQDNQEYPKDLVTEAFVFPIPVDKDEGLVNNDCTFGYTYEVSPNTEGIPNQDYRLSTCLENEDNIIEKAAKDGGIYDNKFEIFSEN